MPDGTLLYVSMTAKRVMAVCPGGDPVVHADLSQIATHFCNDMVVSVDGHAYVGNFGFDLENRLRSRPRTSPISLPTVPFVGSSIRLPSRTGR